jgi:hypothetical protein
MGNDVSQEAVNPPNENPNVSNHHIGSDQLKRSTGKDKKVYPEIKIETESKHGMEISENHIGVAEGRKGEEHNNPQIRSETITSREYARKTFDHYGSEDVRSFPRETEPNPAIGRYTRKKKISINRNQVLRLKTLKGL